MQLSRHSAQQIVEEIGGLVKQNINLMDETGHIIASTDPRRIGSFHEGAYRIISQHLPELYIRQEEETPTVRRGVNLPIELEGEVVGVIGITGGYEEVFAYGQIVQRMTQILMLDWREREQRRLGDRVRSRFLEEWVLGTGLSNHQSLSDRGFALGIDITTPRRVLVVSVRDLPDFTANAQGQRQLELVEDCVRQCVLSRPGAMILRNAGRQILLLPRRDQRDLIFLANRILDQVERTHSVPMLVGVDGQAGDVHTAYCQANRAWRAAAHRRGGLVCYEELGVELLLDDISPQRKIEYLKKIFPKRERSSLREAIALLEAWFHAEGSLSAAAASLFIHKNTLQYRLRSLAEETGLDVRRPEDAPSLYLAVLFHRDLVSDGEQLSTMHNNQVSERISLF